MSSLKYNERQYIESILGMGSVYVLNFSNATFGEFFEGYGIKIHDDKYKKFREPKARKLRTFLIWNWIN